MAYNNDFADDYADAHSHDAHIMKLQRKERAASQKAQNQKIINDIKPIQDLYIKIDKVENFINQDTKYISSFHEELIIPLNIECLLFLKHPMFTKTNEPEKPHSKQLIDHAGIKIKFDTQNRFFLKQMRRFRGVSENLIIKHPDSIKQCSDTLEKLRGDPKIGASFAQYVGIARKTPNINTIPNTTKNNSNNDKKGSGKIYRLKEQQIRLDKMLKNATQFCENIVKPLVARVDNMLESLKMLKSCMYFGSMYFFVGDDDLIKRFKILRSAIVTDIIKGNKSVHSHDYNCSKFKYSSTFRNIIQKTKYDKLVKNKSIIFLENFEIDININNENDVLYYGQSIIDTLFEIFTIDYKKHGMIWNNKKLFKYDKFKLLKYICKKWHKKIDAIPIDIGRLMIEFAGMTDEINFIRINGASVSPAKIQNIMQLKLSSIEKLIEMNQNQNDEIKKTLVKSSKNRLIRAKKSLDGVIYNPHVLTDEVRFGSVQSSKTYFNPAYYASVKSVNSSV